MSAWARVRAQAPDEDLDALDAQQCDRLGLPSLAALLRLRVALLRTMRGRAVAEEYVVPLIQVAVGEATERLRAVSGDDTVVCPVGPGRVPAVVLAFEHQTLQARQVCAHV